MIEQLGLLNILYSLGLIVVCTLTSLFLGLSLEKKILLAAFRACLQLSLLGYVLKWLFEQKSPWVFLIVFLFMAFVASQTAMKRVSRRHRGLFWVTYLSIFSSTLITGSYTLFLSIPQSPWYDLTASIPLIGMILGNSLTGVSLTLGKLTDQLVLEKDQIEESLSLGATSFEACRFYIIDSIQTGMTPILNSMMVVGLVSIPGMMTGQLLAGNSPIQASVYQIVILLIICSTSYLSTLIAALITYKRFLKESHRFKGTLLEEII